MPMIRVDEDALTSMIEATKKASGKLDASSWAGGAGRLSRQDMAELELEAAAGADDAVDAGGDIIQDADSVIERPLWADVIRLRMVKQTLEELAGDAGELHAADIRLAIQLLEVFEDLDKAESSN